MNQREENSYPLKCITRIVQKKKMKMTMTTKKNKSLEAQVGGIGRGERQSGNFRCASSTDGGVHTREHQKTD